MWLNDTRNAYCTSFAETRAGCICKKIKYQARSVLEKMMPSSLPLPYIVKSMELFINTRQRQERIARFGTSIHQTYLLQKYVDGVQNLHLYFFFGPKSCRKGCNRASLLLNCIGALKHKCLETYARFQ